MPYIIENSNGDPILIPDGGLNQDYSIDLVGRNYANYGEKIAKTQIDLLNNFASDNTPPIRPTNGQLWYDQNFKQLRVHDNTTGAWLPTRPLVSTVAPTNTYGQNKAGTTYYNTNTGQLYLNTGPDGYQIANVPGEISTAFSAEAALSNPTFYGSSLRNIFLTDTTGVKRAVLALYYRNDGENTGSGVYQGEKIVAVISGHAQFTVADTLSTTSGIDFNFYDQFNTTTSPNGIGLIIRPGLNARSDSTAYSGNAYRSLRADQAYNLNTGTYSLSPDGTVNDNGGVTIPASDVFHAGADSIPAGAYDLGSNANVFAQGYIQDLSIGLQGGTGSIVPNGNATVFIGIELNPIDFLYVDEITVTGNINMPNGGDLGDPGTPIENIYANNVTVYETLTVDGYQLPTAAGNNGDQIFLGAGGDSIWAAPYNRYNNVYSSDDTVDVSFVSATAINSGTVELNPVAVNLTANVTTLKGEIITIAGDAKSQESLEYDSDNGTLAYTRVTPFDNLSTTDFVLTDNVDQEINGEKVFRRRTAFPAGMDVAKDIRYGSSAVFPAGTGIPDPAGAGLIFRTRDDSTNTSHTIVFDKTGSITATGDISGLSDINLKENIQPIENALDKVRQVSGYTFNFKGNPAKKTGVIAQEIQAVAPEAVGEQDGHLTVAHGNLVGLLFSAINELQDEIAELKKRLGE